MTLSTRTGVEEILHWVFSDNSVSFNIYFNTLEQARTAHYRLEETGLTVSRINDYTMAFTLADVPSFTDLSKYPIPAQVDLEFNGRKLTYHPNDRILIIAGIKDLLDSPTQGRVRNA